MRASRAWRLPGTAFLLGTLGFAGCSPETLDGVGPLVPVDLSANVTGSIVRQGVAVPNLKVVLRDPEDHADLSEDRTDASGRFGLRAPVGISELEIDGQLAGDFSTTTRAVSLATDISRIELATSIDVSAFGARLDSPPAGSRVPVPTPTATLEFRWQMPARSVSAARVQLYDQDGEPVWSSPATLNSAVLWNGIGNQDPYVGQLVPPGDYEWRVKFDLPDEIEARMERQSLVLE